MLVTAVQDDVMRVAVVQLVVLLDNVIKIDFVLLG